MLGSAWEWLVSLVGVSQDGSPHATGSLKPKGSDGVWLEKEWDEADERSMVECILADTDNDDGYLQSLLMLTEGERKQYGNDAELSPGMSRKGGFGRRKGSWMDMVKSRQSDDPADSALWPTSTEIPPPPPLEFDGDSPPCPSILEHKPAEITQSLNSIVCQTSKEQEFSGTPPAWIPKASTSGSSPKSVFDTFAVDDALLPPQMLKDQGKRTLVLDLDETLVHSVFQPTSAADFRLQVQLEQGPLDVYVLKRPGVDNFLQAMAAHFEIVVFTASVKEYADPLLDILDPMGLVSHRLFRDSCTNTKNGYVKDLTRLGRELTHTIIVDNSPHAYAFQPDNALPILSYYDDSRDSELQKITPFLESLGSLPGDVRSLLTAALGANVKSLMQARLAFLL